MFRLKIRSDSVNPSAMQARQPAKPARHSPEAQPIAGTSCGMFGVADTLVVDLSKVRRFVKSIISRS
jgi:hypothetical protein